ncbi:MAG: bifunctional hydroxymethylpyrimidine kinase/phosphomethylpyrimidine kinase [Candidatus Omnitrophica bacterium]|nr:bifunctional hydroxymethylpyrimidine kinase/phosphomethylpyrimidine kinase [Candidatus Omnitrophota bacterium]
MSVLVVGSVALDTIKTPLADVRDVLGGSASYFSVSASFFSPVSLVAVVGSDFPQKYIRLFKKRGIDIRGLETVKGGRTFRWQGRYGWDFNDAKTIATHLNVFASFDPGIIKEHRLSKFVFLANIDPELQQKVLAQVKNPRLVVSDTMNYWIEQKPKSLKKLLKKIDIFLLNDLEARQLTGRTNLLKAAGDLLKLGPKRVIVKKGEHGALLFSKNSLFCMPAFLLENVYDPTGAGDTFAGGFVGYLAKAKSLNERTLRRAMVYASTMATFAVEDFSLKRLLSIRRGDIERRVRQFRMLTSF